MLPNQMSLCLLCSLLDAVEVRTVRPPTLCVPLSLVYYSLLAFQSNESNKNPRCGTAGHASLAEKGKGTKKKRKKKTVDAGRDNSPGSCQSVGSVQAVWPNLAAGPDAVPIYKVNIA